MVFILKILTKNSCSIIESEKFSKILAILLLISFILIPFDDLPYLSKLSGIGRRAAMYPFFVIIPIIAILSIKKFTFYFELTIEKLFLLLFYLWTIISIGVNMSNIINSFYKGESGIEKSIIHLITLTFVIIISYCSEIIITGYKISVYNIRTVICISFIPVAIVSSIEILNILAIFDLSNILEKITYAINLQLRGYVYGGRSRGVSAEASYLGMYCAFIFPWIISYLYTEKNKIKKIAFALITSFILLIVIATKSRTAYILIIFELVSLFIMILLFYSKPKVKIYTTFIIIVSFTLLTLYPKVITLIMNRPIETPNITENQTQTHPTTTESGYEVNSIVSSVTDTENLSNIARSSMQNAALKIGINHPIFGVGLGEFGFNFSQYVSENSLRSHEVQVWLDNSNPTWPPVHSLYHRIIAEIGIPGAILYFAFIFTVCLKLLIKIIKSKNDILGILLLISYTSIIIGSLTIDTFLLTHFWLMTAIVTLYTQDKISIA